MIKLLKIGPEFCGIYYFQTIKFEEIQNFNCYMFSPIQNISQWVKGCSKSCSKCQHFIKKMLQRYENTYNLNEFLILSMSICKRGK